VRIVSTLIVALLILTGPASSDAQESPPAAEVTSAAVVDFDATAVEIGEPVTLDVRFELPPGSDVVGISVSGNPFIEILGRENQSTAGVAAQHWTVQATVYRAGRYDADALVVRLIDAEGNPTTIRSNPFSITTQATFDPTAPPERTATAEPLPVITRDNRPIWVLAALILVGLGWLIERAFRTRTAEDAIAAIVAPPRPAWEVALERLQALEESDFFERGVAIDFHMELSEVLREFIGRHYRFPAVESTTREIAAVLDRDRLGTRQGRELLRILEDTDMVKFARQSLPEDESMSMLIRGRAVVLDLSAKERLAAQSSASGGEEQAEKAITWAPDETPEPETKEGP
jgi:hypothetical protein